LIRRRRRMKEEVRQRKLLVDFPTQEYSTTGTSGFILFIIA